MVDFVHYCESGWGFSDLEYLKTNCFPLMSVWEKGFFNQIRKMYYIASVLSGKHGESGSHVFFGGHVVMNDAGSHYANWAGQLRDGELKGGERWSSHYQDVKSKQYEIVLPRLGCILFGKTSDGSTWFQNESWQATDPGLLGAAKFVAHGVLGYGAHKLSGNRQVGALGYSDWTEKNLSHLIIPREYVPD